jgi:hypothetical protein
MYYLCSLGVIAVISDQKDSNRACSSQTTVEHLHPNKTDISAIQNSVHTTKLNGTHILQMRSLLAFVLALLQQICCSKANRTTRHTVRSRT